jgi:hypothetical protein
VCPAENSSAKEEFKYAHLRGLPSLFLSRPELSLNYMGS